VALGGKKGRAEPRGGGVTDKVVILVTAANLREARKIARRLVESRLAACVNLTPPVQSVYRWQGKIETAREYLLVIKSTRDLFEPLKAEILKNHTYTTPEIVCLPIVEGFADYLAWIDACLQRPAP
jgi:periplasmic divalent cation tolerance protein